MKTNGEKKRAKALVGLLAEIMLMLDECPAGRVKTVLRHHIDDYKGRTRNDYAVAFAEGRFNHVLLRTWAAVFSDLNVGLTLMSNVDYQKARSAAYQKGRKDYGNELMPSLLAPITYFR